MEKIRSCDIRTLEQLREVRNCNRLRLIQLQEALMQRGERVVERFSLVRSIAHVARVAFSVASQVELFREGYRLISAVYDALFEDDKADEE